MFSAGKYRSTEKGYKISENIIFSKFNLTEIFY